jgi:hypothetical protein
VRNTYLEHGQPVTIVTRWGTTPLPHGPGTAVWRQSPKPAPRNVLIRRQDGQLAVRPFRGLRKPEGSN